MAARAAWFGDLGAAGCCAWSGVRCVADEMRLRTFARRLGSDVGAGLVLIDTEEAASDADVDVDEDPTEKRLESLWLAFFFSPSMVRASE